MSVYPDKICHLQQNSTQIILFRLKRDHFRTCFLHMIRYNNASRPVHNPQRPPCDPSRPRPKPGGRDTPSPRIDAYGTCYNGEVEARLHITMSLNPAPHRPIISFPSGTCSHRRGFESDWRLLCRSQPNFLNDLTKVN